MAEYIEKSQLLGEIIRMADGCEYLQIPSESLLNYIKLFPSADVAKVKRGKWIPESKYICRCSCCNECYIMRSDTQENHFCYHCGADLRG